MPVKLWTIDDLGGWSTADPQLFDKNTGSITKIYRRPPDDDFRRQNLRPRGDPARAGPARQLNYRRRRMYVRSAGRAARNFGSA